MSEIIDCNLDKLVHTYFLDFEKKLPLVIEAIAEVDLQLWASNNQEFIESQLLQYGALLFRNFTRFSSYGLENLISTISGEPLEYKERSSPRSSVAGNIYTSTEYPAEQAIPLHCENSYQETWPMHIFFHCVTPASVGGETPIADTRRVFNRINPHIRQRFIENKVMYIRNFYDFVGLPWQTVFQTEDKAQVEAYCTTYGINFEWQGEGHLKTSVVREPVLKHPQSHELVWFNHAMFFHVSTLEPEIKEGLLMAFQPDELPANSFYGDGTQIEDSVAEELRNCYQQEVVLVPWQKGDTLMLDNMLVAHGRQPYSGVRQILVGMASANTQTFRKQF